MENIGIIRRVDDLGRIVIPKEMRKILRIKSGDCLEAFFDNEKIVLLKHDLIGKHFNIIGPILNSYADVLNIDILITDTDKIISAFGKNNNEFENAKIDKYIYQCILNRKKVVECNKILLSKKSNYIIKPIIINGDAIGSVIFIKEKDTIKEIDSINIDILVNIFTNSLEV